MQEQVQGCAKALLVAVAATFFAIVAFLGGFGSYAVLAILFFISFFLCIDHDIFKTLARFKMMYETAKEKFGNSLEEMRRREIPTSYGRKRNSGR